jgi:transcriptional regulator with XRE-family HTH domain
VIFYINDVDEFNATNYIVFQNETMKTEWQMSESLNERLRRLREERNLSAVDVAKLIGVAQTTYRDWENGKGLKLPPYLAISRLFAISVTELVTGERPDIQNHLDDLRDLEKRLTEIRLKLTSAN